MIPMLYAYAALQLSAIALRAAGLTAMPWSAVLAPLWLGPAFLAAGLACGAALWAVAWAIGWLEGVVPLDGVAGLETALAGALGPAHGQHDGAHGVLGIDQPHGPDLGRLHPAGGRLDRAIAEFGLSGWCGPRIALRGAP